MEMEEFDIQGYGIENNPEFVKIACETEKVNVVQETAQAHSRCIGKNYNPPVYPDPNSPCQADFAN